MALISVEIKFYSVKIPSQSNNPEPYDAVIYLATHSTYGTIMLYFLADDKELPENKIEDKGGKKLYNIYYHLSYLGDVLDLLRNERPCYFFVDPGTKFAGVRTGNEPVGEEE